MKSLASALSVLLFVSIVSAQNPSPAQAGMPHHDTMRMGKNAPCAGDAGPMAMGRHGGKRLFPGHGMNFRQDGKTAERSHMRHPGFGKAHRWMREPHAMSRCAPCPFFLCCGILLTGLLLWGIINILLTIIVSVDMTRNGRFNGLWIPVLLIAGIPGSIIYALFRIGDRLPARDNE
ncbi:MAG: hypothetical protein JXA71_10755 [Chitinispirillaceae bacterium]|nr:hypothetical protein [Chitinispirillaceae bacterium]